MSTFEKETNSAELEALTFLQAYTQIPVPKIISSQRLTNGNVKIVMQHVDGLTLDKAKATMSAADLQTVMAHLKVILATMRSLKKPAGFPAKFIGSANGGKVFDMRIDPHAAFDARDEKGFNDYRVRRRVALESKRKTAAVAKVNAVRAKMVDTHATVFTHGDFMPRNILVKGGRVVAIIDWEQAGWRPESWEYIKAVYTDDDGYKDWSAHLPGIMPVYATELQVDNEDMQCGGIPYA